MQIIRVFPRRTSMTPVDDYAFVGNPPLVRLDADEVHVSCTFTWDKPKAEYLADAWKQYYPVKLGGCAYDDPGNRFMPGMYVRQGITFTSRGCNNNCPWCLVPDREGSIREMPIVEGNTIRDNNFLQCSKSHRDRVFDMLKKQHTVQFSGGLDTRLITDEIAGQIRGLRIFQVFLACDTKESIKALRTAIQKLQLPQQKIRCYALLKFTDETISDATERMIEIWKAGAMPFAQLYQPKDKLIQYSTEWLHFQRTWQRVAAMKSYVRELGI